MGIEVRPIEAGEARPWLASMVAAFFQQLDEGRVEFWVSHFDLARTWAAFDGGRLVGTLRSFPIEVTVPGPAALAASAITNVAVAPTHRRRGLLTEMLAADLRASAEREEPLAVLVASEWPIYGRFGFGPAIEAASYALDCRRARFLHPRRGSVELVDDERLCEVGPAIYDRYRLTQPGAISRHGWWWERAVRVVDPPGPSEPVRVLALYCSESGGLDGFARYHVSSKWEAHESQARIVLDDLVATTADAWEELWRFCGSVDLAVEVQADQRPVDEPLALLLEDGRAARQTHRYDFIWVRPLDVPAALAGRGYLHEGSLVLEVTDPLSYATGTYRLDAGPDGAACSRTSESPQLSLGIDALGSLYLGGIAAQALGDAGRIDEHREGAVAAASRLFSTSRPPWCATSF